MCIERGLRRDYIKAELWSLTMHRKLSAILAAGVLTAPAAASAHHSYAMFDQNKEVVLKDATVKEWQWTSPHTWLFIYVPNGTATPEKYSIEGGNPGALRRQGFGIGSMKPGDKITAYVHPLKSGEKGGSLFAVVLPNGKRLGAPAT